MNPFKKQMLDLRYKIVHGSAKVAIPTAIMYAHQTFRCQEGCNTLVRSVEDMEDDTRAFNEKVFYFNTIKKILMEGRYKFEENHTTVQALEVAFTLMDADPAYEDLLKDFYAEEEKHFWKKFKSENFQIEH